MKSAAKWPERGDNAPKNEEIQPQAKCSSNRAVQVFSNLNHAETRMVRAGLVK
jgi:hypothetical protein